MAAESSQQSRRSYRKAFGMWRQPTLLMAATENHLMASTGGSNGEISSLWLSAAMAAGGCENGEMKKSCGAQ